MSKDEPLLSRSNCPLRQLSRVATTRAYLDTKKGQEKDKKITVAVVVVLLLLLLL